MRPVKGITAGGSRITFVGENLDAFLPLGAYFIPPENSTLPPLYGFAYSRSGDLRYSFSSLYPCHNEQRCNLSIEVTIKHVICEFELFKLESRNNLKQLNFIYWITYILQLVM